jgi:hypothetical protein
LEKLRKGKIYRRIEAKNGLVCMFLTERFGEYKSFGFRRKTKITRFLIFNYSKKNPKYLILYSLNLVDFTNRKKTLRVKNVVDNGSIS